MRLLISMLFILAVTLFSRAENAFNEGFGVDVGGQVIAFPVAMDTNVFYVTSDFMNAWQELEAEMQFSSFSVTAYYTNAWDQILTLTRGVADTGYLCTRLDLNMAGITNTSPLFIAEGSVSQLTGSDTVALLELSAEIKWPSVNANSVFGTTLLPEAIGSGEYFIETPFMLDFDGPMDDGEDVSVSFVSNAGTNTTELFDNRAYTWTVSGSTMNTNSLRGDLGGLPYNCPANLYSSTAGGGGGIVFDPPMEIYSSMKESLEYTSITSSLNDIVGKANAAPAITDPSTNLIANASLFTFSGVGGFYEINHNGYAEPHTNTVLFVGAGDRVDIAVPASFMDDPNANYILSMSLASDGSYVLPQEPTSKDNRYKVGGISYPHDDPNAAGDTKFVQIPYQSGAFTLGVYSSASYPSAWDHMYLIKESTDRNVYSTMDHSATNYVRNTSCWAYGLDLTPFSVWNSYAGGDARGRTLRAGTALGKRIVALAEHYKLPDGTVMRWVTSDNEVVERTVIGSTNVSHNGYATDCNIAILDSDLPAAISICKSFPTDWMEYIPSGSFSLPMLMINQRESIFLGSTHINTYGSNGWKNYYPASNRVNFRENDTTGLLPDQWGTLGHLSNFAGPTTTVEGDSGSPSFIYIDGSPVIMTCFETSYIGPSYIHMVSEINAAVSGMGVSETLTEVDFSQYRSKLN